MNNGNNKSIFLKLALILCIVAGARYLGSVIFLLLVAIGVLSALGNKNHLAICSYILLCLFVPMNPLIVGKAGMIKAICLRVGPLLIGLIMALMSLKRTGNARLPFSMLVIYLVSVSISSLQGWSPTISLLKMLNFAIFLVGIWFGLQNMQNSSKAVKYVYEFLIAVSVFIVVGSAALIPFPGVSTLNGLTLSTLEGDISHANYIYGRRDAGMTLFCGLANQSQALAPILACIFSWLSCDIIFVAKRFELLRSFVAALCIPLLFMTRSRAGLLALIAAFILVYYYGFIKMTLAGSMRFKIRRLATVSLFVVLIVGVFYEVHDNAFTKWLRKTDDLEGDKRSLTEAVTSSRQGLNDLNIMDFERNYLLGSGFQVNFESEELYGSKGGLILSAPIEKGLLPMMILGEGGIIGGVLFTMFLVSFYLHCNRKRYYCTAVCFGVFLSTNIGEATFFSPGGIGAILWSFSVIGGFMLDLIKDGQLPNNFYFIEQRMR